MRDIAMNAMDAAVYQHLGNGSRCLPGKIQHGCARPISEGA
jgi:hypothetical protein